MAFGSFWSFGSFGSLGRFAPAGTLRAIASVAGEGPWRRTAVGIDVGTGAVKVVALSAGRRRGDLRLERCAMETCAAASGAEPGANEAISRQDALRDVLSRAGIRVRDAVLGVPDHAVRSATAIVAASMSVQERRWEAEDLAYRLFPAPAEPCFDVVEQPAGKAGHVELRVLATSGAVAAARVSVAAAADVRVAVLDLDGFALRRALAAAGAAGSGPAGDSRPWMLADLGAGHPAAMFCRGTVPQMSIPMARARLAEAGHDVAGIVAAVGAAMDVFRATAGGSGGPPSRIVLAGGRAAMPGLREAVARRTGLPVALADPFAGMAVGPEIDRVALAATLPAYLLATGLALRGLL